MSVAITRLRAELRELEGIYGLRFANHSRVTRNVKVLDDLIERAGALRKKLAAQKGAEARELRTRASEMLSQYTEEREQIKAVQTEGGPELIEARILGQRANFVIYRYRRHFAGKGRNTRDLALMAEMVEDLRAIQSEMVNLSNAYGDLRGLGDDLEVVQNHIELFTKETDAIAQAQATGTPEERGGLLGALANAQFENYRIFFSGRARLSRRPELLERIIGNLDFVLEEMEGLEERGLREDFNRKNQQIVRERRAGYQEELSAIRQARAEASLPDVLEALGQAANGLLGEYSEQFAGQSRETRELSAISELCDLMGEVERQMTVMARVSEVSNLDIARDALTMFEREYREIAKVQDA